MCSSSYFTAMYKRERKLPPSVRADLQCVVKKVLFTERRVPYTGLVYIYLYKATEKS